MTCVYLAVSAVMQRAVDDILNPAFDYLDGTCHADPELRPYRHPSAEDCRSITRQIFLTQLGALYRTASFH